ncbi:hypothetical protein PRIPAC_85057, partial [Pristionchus pacificus]
WKDMGQQPSTSAHNDAPPSFLSHPPKEEEVEDRIIPSTTYHNAAPSTSSQSIKQEVEDNYDYGDVKMEMEIKEEDEEEMDGPIADTVKLSELCSSTNGFHDPTSSTSQPSLSSSSRRKQKMTLSPPPPECAGFATAEAQKLFFQSPVNCPYCGVEIPDGKKLEQHMKINHRDHWLKYVQKCPVNICDFRSSDPSVVQRHHVMVHNRNYNTRMGNAAVNFKFVATCPFCPDPLRGLAGFVQHMEKKHPRLCTYEAKILACAECRYSTSNVYMLLTHWLKTVPMCTQGLRFNYEIAANTKINDAVRERDERARMSTIVLDNHNVIQHF